MLMLSLCNGTSEVTKKNTKKQYKKKTTHQQHQTNNKYDTQWKQNRL